MENINTVETETVVEITMIGKREAINMEEVVEIEVVAAVTEEAVEADIEEVEAVANSQVRLRFQQLLQVLKSFFNLTISNSN